MVWERMDGLLPTGLFTRGGHSNRMGWRDYGDGRGGREFREGGENPTTSGLKSSHLSSQESRQDGEGQDSGFTQADEDHRRERRGEREGGSGLGVGQGSHWNSRE